MDRLRVGLTGLGLVFLLTLGVSLLFGPKEASPVVVEALKEPGEPLAQLGVTPGSEKASDPLQAENTQILPAEPMQPAGPLGAPGAEAALDSSPASGMRPFRGGGSAAVPAAGTIADPLQPGVRGSSPDAGVRRGLIRPVRETPVTI